LFEAIDHSARRELFTALAGSLRRNGIPNPECAIEVLGPPHYTVRLFGIILSERANAVLMPTLMEITGRLHPTIADVWLLSEQESAALIRALRGNSPQQ
jgi:hypothetical protein